MKRTSGEGLIHLIPDGRTASLVALFEMQKKFQKEVTGLGSLPQDHVEWFQYHMTAMQEELGEVLKADKRWKTHRNHRFEPEEKLDEIADVFITALNIAMFSGFDSDDIFNAVAHKIGENYEKFLSAKEASR